MQNISMRTITTIRFLRLVLGTLAVILILFGGLVPLPIANSAPLAPQDFVKPSIVANAPSVAGDFSALGTGIDGRVHAIEVIGNDIYAGGFFKDAAGISDADFIAKFDGTAWSAVGGGLNYIVQAMATDGTNLYVGGSFTDAGGVADADYLAKFDGTTSGLAQSPKFGKKK